MSRTVVVGLDGASWRLLDRWIADGTLPNLARLREEGVWARSRSCLPPVTVPNWKCYASGKNPGKLGVYWFERVDLSDERIEVVDSRDFPTAELWDYLAAGGHAVAVLNAPTTYPPRETDGLLVAGGPGAVEGEYRSLETGYAWPPTLEAVLADAGYRVHPEPLLSGNDQRGAEVDAILDLFDTRFEVGLSLLEDRDLDFLQVTLYYLNALHHFFWDEEPTRRGWQVVDRWLGRLAGLDDTNLVLVSDHGSAPTTTEFYINEWLAKRGYQTRRRTVDGFLGDLGLTRENALRLAKRFGLVEHLSETVPERLQRLVPREAGLKRDRKLDALALDRTAAVASSQGPIYLHPDVGETVRTELIETLRAVADDRGPLFTGVYRGEEVYDGPYVDDAPEIVLEQRAGVHVNDAIGGGKVMTEPDRWRAENTREGIFLARGPDFATGDGFEDSPISILDIAPTLLAAADCPVPTDVDGRILSVIGGGADVDYREPLSAEGTAGDRTPTGVSERLQRLGYTE